MIQLEYRCCIATNFKTLVCMCPDLKKFEYNHLKGALASCETQMKVSYLKL